MPRGANEAMAAPPTPHGPPTATSPARARTVHGKSLSPEQFSLSKEGRGSWDWAASWDGMMGVEVQARGHLGTAPFAAFGDRTTGAGGESPAVLEQG